MSGLFGTLGIANRSMLVVQNGIRTTSHNISNANTPGYSRQVQILRPGLAIQDTNGALGTGVEQQSIERVTNEFVSRQLLEETSNQRSLQAQTSALEAVEQVFNEQSQDGVSASLEEFYSSLDALANNPGAVERAGVIGTADRLADTLRFADTQLRDQMVGANQSLTGAVVEINALANRIAELNVEIVRQEGFSPANDLRDQRDLALRELAGLSDIETFSEPNGSVVVMMRGAGTLVQGQYARALVTTSDPGNPFDPNFSRILFDDGTSQRDITASVAGGELGGILAARDSILPDAVRSLDVLAFNLAESVNAVHRRGFGLDGSSGNDFFVAPSAVEDAARDLTISSNIRSNAGTIAAGGLGPAPGDNENALALRDLRGTAIALQLPGDALGSPSGPSRSLLEHASALISDVGLEAITVRDARDQSSRVLGVLEDRRDSISGVSIDEEVTNLVRLQATFQANARVLSTVDQLLQDLVNIL